MSFLLADPEMDHFLPKNRPQFGSMDLAPNTYVRIDFFYYLLFSIFFLYWISDGNRDKLPAHFIIIIIIIRNKRNLVFSNILMAIDTGIGIIKRKEL